MPGLLKPRDDQIMGAGALIRKIEIPVMAQAHQTIRHSSAGETPSAGGAVGGVIVTALALQVSFVCSYH